MYVVPDFGTVCLASWPLLAETIFFRKFLVIEFPFTFIDLRALSDLVFEYIHVDEKSEKRKAMIRLKTEEYMRRAEEIKQSLNKPAEDSYVIPSLCTSY